MTIQNWLRMMAAADPAKRASFVEAADVIDTLTRERDEARAILQNIHENTAGSGGLGIEAARWKLQVVHDRTSHAKVSHA